jgi:predicted SnoaL-like aldol condensation-catalyzing enzyme
MSSEKSKSEENKKIVVAFYQKALFEGDVDTAIRLYGGPHYTQHTPFAGDGFDGLREYVKWIAKNYPNIRGEIKRVFADGDYVFLHCHYTGFFGPDGDAIIDNLPIGERQAGRTLGRHSSYPREVTQQKHHVLIRSSLLRNLVPSR